MMSLLCNHDILLLKMYFVYILYLRHCLKALYIMIKKSPLYLESDHQSFLRITLLFSMLHSCPKTPLFFWRKRCTLYVMLLPLKQYWVFSTLSFMKIGSTEQKSWGIMYSIIANLVIAEAWLNWCFACGMRRRAILMRVWGELGWLNGSERESMVINIRVELGKVPGNARGRVLWEPADCEIYGASSGDGLRGRWKLNAFHAQWLTRMSYDCNHVFHLSGMMFLLALFFSFRTGRDDFKQNVSNKQEWIWVFLCVSNDNVIGHVLQCDGMTYWESIQLSKTYNKLKSTS